MNVLKKRSIQTTTSFLLGALTLYLGGLFTLTILNTSTAAGLLAPIIIGPIIVAAVLWKAATAKKHTAKTTRYTIAAAFTIGFLLAATLWLYMAYTALGPIANMS